MSNRLHRSTLADHRHVPHLETVDRPDHHASIERISTRWAAALVVATVSVFVIILTVAPPADPEATVNALDNVLALGALMTLGGVLGTGLNRSGLAPWMSIGFGGFLAAGQVSCLVAHGAPATAGWFWIQNVAIAALLLVGRMALRSR